MALKYLYVPSAYNTSTAYGVLPNDSAADFDEFARGSSAHRVNKDGLLEEMGSNIPRIDYSDGGCPSLLLEPQRTNKIEYSEDFSQSSWSKNDVTTSANQSVSPKGSIDATKLIEGTGSVEHYTEDTTTLTAAGDYSFSVFAKADDYDKIRVRPVHVGASEGTTTDIDFTLTNNGSYSTLPSYATASIENYGNGWYRCVVNVSLTGPITSIRHRIQLVKDGDHIYQGDGSSGVFIWGAQLEEANYPTSYIKNSGTSSGATRSADASYFTGELQSYMDTSEGVFEVKAKALSNGGRSASGRISFSDISGYNTVTIAYPVNPNDLFLIFRADTSNIVNTTILDNSFTQDETNTVKVKWKSGDIQVKVNGTVIFSDSSTFSLGDLKKVSMSLAGNAAYNRFEGHIYHIKFYDSIDDF